MMARSSVGCAVPGACSSILPPVPVI